ncbi:MAG TPA: hypothetical protein EYO07_09735 [Candidatus Marinimicrobia bacterium]|nr:hypothetical protein [Candidatus Neomarinimicrobiota bacterium]
MKTILLLFLIIPVLAQPPEKPVTNFNPLNRMAGKTTASIDRKYGDHAGNRILCRFFNFGGIGDAGGPFSGIYPIGSGYAYFFEFTPVVAASVVDTSGIRRHIVSDGAIWLTDVSPEGTPWGFEPLPGYANPNQEYMAMSNIEDSWPESWPNKDSDWDGYWNGQYGKYTRADQESYFVMDDYYNDEYNYFPDSTDIGQVVRRSGLGIQIEARGYQWNHPAAEDIIIITYWITNVGTSPLDSVVFGMYGDADVGGSSDFHDDDAWFDTENDMVFQWDHNSWSDSYGGFKPVYFGWSFLESPGNPYDGIDNDEDGMVDESQFDGIDNDGDWLAERDDIGSDGLAEYHEDYSGPDEDGTEGNGVPDVGEPNFEITDNDESDQIGLTSFYSAPYPSIEPDNDVIMWNQLTPGLFQVPGQNLDQTFLYGSGYISLEPGESKKFAVAMVFGNDEDDITRNTTTMQNIYDNDYSFAKPPLKPTLTAVPGDNQVTLYWDSFSEKSKDPIYGEDFEGYRIYRSTDSGFIDSYTVTDAFGNITFKDPLVIFDLVNGLEGPHPIGFNGLQFDMGKNSGLEYIFIDSVNVINGQKYYYGVTAFDKGYDLDFFDLGISDRANLLEIAPSECSITMDLDFKGNVINVSRNAAIVTPNAPSAGYVPPNTITVGEKFIKHLTGFGSGVVEISVIDPYAVRDNNEYQVVFDTLSAADEVVFNIRNEENVLETVTILDSTARSTYAYIDSASIMVTDVSGSYTYSDSVDYEMDYERGIITVSNNTLLEAGSATISYKYFPIFHSAYMNGEDNNPVFHGMKVFLYDSDVGLNHDSTKWTIGESNYRHEINPIRLYPADFELQFEGDIGDSVTVDNYGTRSPFRVKNVTHDNYPPFRISDYDHDDEWDPDEPFMIRPYEGETSPVIAIRFYLDSLVISGTTIYDTVYTAGDTVYTDTTLYDTTYLEVIHPKMGDVFRVAIYRPFSMSDIFSFTTLASTIDKEAAKNQLDEVAVVPNPYVVAASWEPRHIYQSGRGPRKLDFIHLPSQCTIKIFTLAGYLVDTIEHNSLNEDGSESWDLLSKDGLEIAFGVYLYHISAKGIGETTGKFALVK